MANKIGKALYELLEIFKDIDKEDLEGKGNSEHIVINGEKVKL